MQALKTGLSLQIVEAKDSISSQFTFIQRWAVYNHWIELAVAGKTKELEEALSTHEHIVEEANEIDYAQTLYVMRKQKIIGLTATGASRMSKLLDNLAPKILIVEEAAELLEAQLIACLSTGCQHLILIDHLQLRPSTCVYDLAKNYNLDVSLFERFVTNGLPHVTLNLQHRMRPEISQLVISAVYPNLTNHPKVYQYPNVRGLEKNVFFVTHEHREDVSDGQTSSHSNQYEAKYVHKLCRHLIMQDYRAEQITVLTPYIAQFSLLMKMKSPPFTDIRICTVDNYQGEENDIILLSLVRNNDAGDVGFVAISNRICVALSRARYGLYILGNMDQLQFKSKLWRKIGALLEENQCISSELTIVCPNHPTEKQAVCHYDDFQRLSPSGGCDAICSFYYDRCEHRCERLCHGQDTMHKRLLCLKPCSNIICKLSHQCPRTCGEECEDMCKVPVEKTLTCGHVASMNCSQNENKYLCLIPVTKEMPDCTHINEMSCCKDPYEVHCKQACIARLDCGHLCRGLCHNRYDPEHEKYVCTEPCSKKRLKCSLEHMCDKKCGQNCDLCMEIVDKVAVCGHTVSKVLCHREPICYKKCKKILECGHPCQRKCHEECGGCKVVVKKLSPECNHEINVPCSENPSKKFCKKQCTLKLECGHRCMRRCQDKCTDTCTQLIESNLKCLKHEQMCRVPCSEKDRKLPDWLVLDKCEALCETELPCGHICKGKCGECFRGRLHVRCTENCKRILVCGHMCKQPCSSNCPPCQELCELQCGHSRCTRKCSVNCIDCQEKCVPSCEHVKCKKKCSNVCSVSCMLPCPKKLKCGHDCIGFCGDFCPRLCRICDNEELCQTILSGAEEEEDARFVELPKCRHVIEETALTSWMSMEVSEVGCKKCPICRTPIYNLPRYKKYIQRSLKDIVKINQRYFPNNVRDKVKRIRNALDLAFEYAKKMRTLKMYEEASSIKRDLINIFEQIPRKNRYHTYKLSNMEFESLFFKTNFHCKYQELRMKIQFKSEQFDFESRKLLHVVCRLPWYTSVHMFDEISCELQRLTILPSFLKVSQQMSTSCESQYKTVSTLMNMAKFSSKIEKDVLGLIDSYIKINEKQLKLDRLTVVKAIGLTKGHWFKCPNGHFYCIGECGGATETSICPECKEEIGGTGHRLLSTNSLATEMDGASYAAWSDTANMANYHLD